jgi:hypothetical protein
MREQTPGPQICGPRNVSPALVCFLENIQGTMFMRSFCLLLFTVTFQALGAQLPKPDHIVIIIFENRSYTYLKDNVVKAPFINSLLADSHTALFTQSYAITNPSQPNYLALYSGSNQGVTTDDVPGNLPFSTCNLGAGLLAKGYSISGYCEDLPSVGYLGSTAGGYVKRHNPIAYWQGSGPNQTPPGINKRFADFPSDYNTLPDVSFVIPNLYNNMHSGSTNAGDDWFRDHLKAYMDWAKTNNSLLILTFDEDDEKSNNHILTFFYGPMVKGGEYNARIDHYSVLRTLEDIYGLSHCGNSAAASPVDYVWTTPTGIEDHKHETAQLKLFPSPARDNVTVRVSGITKQIGTLELADVSGRKLLVRNVDLKSGPNSFNLSTSGLCAGIYLVQLRAPGLALAGKFMVD